MFRRFKRHYHLTKTAHQDAVQDFDSFGFTIGFKGGKGYYSEENTPDRPKTSRFATLVLRFLHEDSPINYQKVLYTLRNDFAEELKSVHFEEIDKLIANVELGALPLDREDGRFTGKDMFWIIARAGYYELDDDIKAVWKEIQNYPFGPQIFFHNFKVYAFHVFNVISIIFDLILKVENTSKYQKNFPEQRAKTDKCIYCLTVSGRFDSEEHIFPESLIGDEIFLPKGTVCDECNNGISSNLNSILLNWEPIAFLRTQFTPFTKQGKFPKANFHNLLFERTEPNHIHITIKDKSGMPKSKTVLEDGTEIFNFNWKGKKTDKLALARAVYKIGLGLIADELGQDAVLDPRYDAARNFIVKGTPFRNNLALSTKTLVHEAVRACRDFDFGGSMFVIDIFGVVFQFNLELEPIGIMGEVTKKALAELSGAYQFELIPLAIDVPVPECVAT